jgi:glycine/D-amino acid oxidase-like deaminating enzyme/nitrite reductase/ring-hydroxylating ferredoxin subunit
MTVQTNGSWWLARTPPPELTPLAEDLDTDVVVVGGGMAGLCTAWCLSSAGREVVVLDAGRIGMGVSGHTTAKVSALHDTRYASLATRMGTAAASAYARSQSGAVDAIERICADLAIDCDFVRVPAHAYTRRAKQVSMLQAEADAAAQAGLPASFVTQTSLPFGVAGAVRVEQQAQFDPQRFMSGLVAAMLASGRVRIHERSRVLSLKERGDVSVVTQAGRTVRAAHAVVTTHYPVFDRGLYFARLPVHRDFALVARASPAVPLDGHFISVDGDQFSVRTAPTDGDDQMLVFSGMPFRPGSGGRRELDALVRQVRTRFPTVLDIPYRWAAQDTSTQDQVPYIGRFLPTSKATWVATGFGGWGMSNAMVAAAVLTGHIQRDVPEWAGLYDPWRVPGARGLLSIGKEQVEVGAYFAAGHVRGQLHRGTDGTDLAPGQARVVGSGATPTAMYRDDAGTLHCVSAVCTHLGCVVGFNEAERTWECPCHGSRFAPDGTVVQGPANQPLPTVHPTPDKE